VSTTSSPARHQTVSKHSSCTLVKFDARWGEGSEAKHPLTLCRGEVPEINGKERKPNNVCVNPRYASLGMRHSVSVTREDK
jgi:hypothetical protein